MLCAQVSTTNISGYLIAFGGVCYYNYRKLQAMQLKAKQAALAAQQKADVEKRMPSVAGDKVASELTPLMEADTIKARRPEDVAQR